VMHQRIAEKNWDVAIDPTAKRFTFKKRFLYWFEKWTGIRPFSFRNYTLIN
jgi:hypothetical protein